MGLFDSIGKAVTKNPLMRALGMSGEQGEYFQPENHNAELEAFSRAAQAGSPLLDPTQGSRMATSEVQNNPLFASLLGEGGLQGRLNDEEQKLASQGFQLQPEDHEAYGQASGDIARLFGQQENSLAQSLASRGLAQGANGAAMAGFAGLAGNKNEQLAKTQMNIANQRMQNTMQRLNNTRGQMQNLGQFAGDQVQNQYGRAMQGYQQKMGDLGNAAGMRQNQLNSANDSNMASMADKRDAKGKTIFEALGSGMMSSASNIGAAPGKAVSSLAGKAGAKAGE